MTKDEALKLALSTLNEVRQETLHAEKKVWEAIYTIKKVLAQPKRDYERGFVDGMQKQMQSSVDKAVNAMPQPERSMKVEGPLHVVCQCNKCNTQPEQKPVAWMNNKDFEPIRVRIMQEAYELADRNDSEGYNAIKVMCGDVQRMLPPQRTWVGLTDEEIDQGLLRSNHALQTAGAWRDGVEWATKQLKEKNT